MNQNLMPPHVVQHALDTPPKTSDKALGQTIFGGLQPLSLIDFPGKLAAVLFTQGCNFRCLYCHNAALIPFTYKASSSDHYTLPKILSWLERRRGVLDGVVITGGEPTLQPGLSETLRQIRDLGFALKLDTNGSRPEVLKHLIQANLLDYVAMDVKAPLPQYDAITGCHVNTARIAESLAILKHTDIPYEIRTTVADPLLSAEDVLRLARGLNGVPLFAIQNYRDVHRTPDASAQRVSLRAFAQDTLIEIQQTLLAQGQPCLIR